MVVTFAMARRLTSGESIPLRSGFVYFDHYLCPLFRLTVIGAVQYGLTKPHEQLRICFVCLNRYCYPLILVALFNESVN